MVMYAITDTQYQAVYNVLSFALASMMATTVYLWFRSFAVKDQYRSAVLISGLVTFIAAYHYISAVVIPYLFHFFPPPPPPNRKASAKPSTSPLGNPGRPPKDAQRSRDSDRGILIEFRLLWTPLVTTALH